MALRAPVSWGEGMWQLSVIDPGMGLKPIEEGSPFPLLNYGALVLQ